MYNWNLEGEGGKTKIFEEIRVGSFLNLMKITDPRSSMDLRYKKHEENDIHLCMGFPRQECWNRMLFPGDLLDPGIDTESPALTGGFFTTDSPGKPDTVPNPGSTS